VKVPHSKSKIGDIAGCLDSEGYRVIQYRRKAYKAHNIIWLLMKGEFPPNGFVVDHEDFDSSNNRWGNLRVITEHNSRIYRRIHKRNTTGFKGVTFRARNKQYEANIGVNGRVKYLGVRDTPEEAYALYCEASKKYHGEFGNVS
jgi:hypothetical protein